MSNTSVGFNKKQIAIIFKIAFLEAMALSIILPSVVSTGEINVGTILPSTFVIQIGGSNIYNAFRTGGSASVPQYTESNFTKLVNDDILNGAFCINGCSSVLDPGSYNQTQTIQVKKNFVMSGTSASIIFSQPTFSTANFNVSSSSFTFNGARIDDFSRRFIQTGGCSINSIVSQVPCHIPIVIYGSNCFITNSQIFNTTASGIYLTRLSSNCVISFNTIFNVPAQFTNSSQSTSIGIVASGSSHRISNNVVAWMRGGAGIQMGSGVINNALHSFSVENTLFNNEYGVRTVSAIDMHINDNTIYNASSQGIVVDTSLISSTFGPLTISGNNIGESSNGGPSCACPSGTVAHITLQGNRCCWYSVSITGNSMLDRHTNITTKVDIEVITQNYRNLTITGNAVGRSRITPTILLDVNPPDRTWLIGFNPGFNPQPVRGPLTAGATPFTYTNNDAYMEQISIITLGDTTSIICRGITQILTAGETTPILNTLDTCIFTYVVMPPTYDVLPT